MMPEHQKAPQKKAFASGPDFADRVSTMNISQRRDYENNETRARPVPHGQRAKSK